MEQLPQIQSACVCDILSYVNVCNGIPSPSLWSRTGLVVAHRSINHSMIVREPILIGWEDSRKPPFGKDVGAVGARRPESALLLRDFQYIVGGFSYRCDRGSGA
jgi:hypothetical protein